MNKSTILIANFHKGRELVRLSETVTKEKFTVLFGYDVTTDPIAEQLRIAEDIMSSLLTYEKILLFANNITELINTLGYEDVLTLLRSHLVLVIPDSQFNPAIFLSKGQWEPKFIGYSIGNDHAIYEHRFGHLEYWLRRKGFSDLQVNTMLVLLEENAVDFDSSKSAKIILDENSKDLRRMDFLTDPEFFQINDGKLTKNLLGELRLLHLNTLLCISSQYGIDGLKADGAINSLLCKKTSSLLPDKLPDGSEALNSITKQKGFPNLGELYLKKIIGIDDILSLRDSFDGKMYRYWANQDDYQEGLMRQDILNSINGVLGNKVANLIRMSISNCVGLFGFVPGIASSAFDSFVIDKLSKGWHPNLFLDNKLKSLIDDKIAESKKEHEVALLREKFNGVGRNDLCPCGSGKKFKKCHGKEL